MPSETDQRLIVRAASDVAYAPSRGDLRVRRVFEAADMPFRSGLQFILHNRLPAGGANERHVHDDVEKVYYFLAGSGTVICGEDTSPVTAGDFLFFPAQVPHEIHASPDADLEFVVCAARIEDGEARA